MREILIAGDRVDSALVGLTEKDAALAAAGGCALTVLCFCLELTKEETGMFIAAGAGKVLQAALDPEDINSEQPAAEWLSAYVRQYSPAAVLFSGSLFLKTVAARAAVRLDCGLTADCTELSWDESGKLLQTRPTFGGRQLAVIGSRTEPVLATVRKGVFPPSVPEGQTAAEAERIPMPDLPVRWTETGKTEAAGAETLSGAKVILSAGLGIGSAENFRKLEKLAEKVGAAVGASRAAVAAGFAPPSCQIGQTGLSVRPQLYVAFGISGAVQHMSGLLGAKQIISVNRDPDAPIHRFSDLSLTADCTEVLDRLLKEFHC